MALHWDDTRCPRGYFRSNEDSVFRGDGLVRPRLLNIGSILGVGAWSGLPRMQEPGMIDLAREPSCGADIIVSILYRHSSTTLNDFFAASDFDFVHSNEAVDPRLASTNSKKFFIGRKGFLVKAGFLKESSVTGVAAQRWTSFVEYELLRNPSNHEVWWRQLTLQEKDDTTQEQHDIPDMPLDRAIWELDAVTILGPALSERRWMKRPGGFQVKVTLHSTQIELCNRTEDEKLDQANRSMSEVDYDAEGETVSGDSSPALDTAVSNEHSAVVIPGTEDFDDVGALLQAADAEKKIRYGKLSNGHRVGKMAPETSQA